MGNGVRERIDNWVTGTVQHSLLLTLYFVDRGWFEGHQRWSPCGRQGFDIPPHDCWCSPRVSTSSLTAWTHETKEKSVSLSDKLKVSRCIYGEKSIRHDTVHHSYTIASLNSNFTCQNGRVSSVLSTHLRSTRSFWQFPMNVPNCDEKTWSWSTSRNRSLNSNADGNIWSSCHTQSVITQGMRRGKVR